jgi:glucose/mannose transport system substrate-binding protein
MRRPTRTRGAASLAGTLLVAASIVGTPAAAQDAEIIEVFSYWTAGGEAEGLKAAEAVFAATNPNVAIQNTTIAGGAGVNANVVFASRMAGGDPPDTFHIHAGAQLLDEWVKGGEIWMTPLTDLYEAQGLAEVFPAGLVDLVSHEGVPYAVPLGVHRNGVLWFNKAIFDEHGLAAPTTWDEFFTMGDALQEAGVTPLAFGSRETWAAFNLFEQILLAELGAEDFRALWAGSVSWTDPRVTAALETFGRVLDYVNTDHSTLVWNEAAQLVVDGSAAMTVMGDWTKGYFTNLGWQPDVDFGWAPVPGTDGTFMVVTDAFASPRDAANPENAQLWLTTVASVEGQDAFNPIKGSIPARSDADRSKYDVYSTAAMDDFASEELVPSQANGPATVPAFTQPSFDIIAKFLVDRDVAAAQAAFDEQCRSTGACPS